MYFAALVGMGIQAIVSLAVGLRLLSLARRSRRFPELALSAQTLLLPALGYPAVMAGVALERLGLPGVSPVFFVATSVMMFAISMNYFFTWRVFRPETSWAATLCILGTWLLVAPIGGVITHIEAKGIDAGMQSAQAWTLPIMAGVLTSFAWTGAESFRYYLNSRRQLRLGLVEAAVCNRFLMWSLGSTTWLLMGVFAGCLLATGVNPLNHGGFTLLVGVSGLMNSTCIGLCFMPPERYVTWLERRAAAVQGA